jgi:uncharacterized protein
VKALLLLLVVLACVWIWRNRMPSDKSQTSTKTPHQPLDMVRCTRCGVHVPANDAVQGQKGTYCCQDHLLQSEP